jgi:cytochrome P450
MTNPPRYPHDLFTDGVLRDPYGHYRALRDLGPVVWLEAHEMYAVPRYAEVRAVLADADTYCSGQGVALNEAANVIAAGRNTLMTDGELHEHLRRVLARSLTPRALRAVDHSTRVAATELVTSLVARGRFDAVADLARSLPLTVVPDLIGWPIKGRANLLEWGSAAFDFLGPMNKRAQQAVPPTRAMFAFADDVAELSSMLPGSVGAGVIEAARQGELDLDQVPALIVGYLAPSLDTTISAIASAVWLLAQHPAQWAALRANPDLVPNALSETLRLESPLRALSRVTTGPARIGQVDIPAGARLVVLYGSANRDERHFPAPDQFDISRANANEHLGFGYGVHSCPGQGLARMQAHALLSELATHVARIELARPAPPVLNNLINGRASVHVTVTPASTGDVNARI